MLFTKGMPDQSRTRGSVSEYRQTEVSEDAHRLNPYCGRHAEFPQLNRMASYAYLVGSSMLNNRARCFYSTHREIAIEPNQVSQVNATTTDISDTATASA